MNRVNRLIGVFHLYWLVAVISVVMFLVYQNAITVLLGIPTFIDEIIQVLMLTAIAFKARKDKVARFVCVFFFLTFFVMILMSVESLSHRGLSLVLQQIYVHLKYVVYIGFLIFYVPPSIARFTLGLTLIISIVFLVFELVTPGAFHSALQIEPQYRGGFIRPIGIQGHTGLLGFFMAFAAIYYVSGKKHLNDWVKMAIMFVMVTFILLTSVRTGLIVFVFMMFWMLKNSFIKFAPILSVIIVTALAVGSNKYVDDVIEITQQNIEMSIEDPSNSAYIRGMMIYFSLELAADRFPLGTGAASFGTVKSDDSNIYAELGVHNSRFFYEKDGIYDSNLASVLGEFGYIGLLLYYGTFIVFCIMLMKHKTGSFNKELVFVSLSSLLVYSTTNPVFMNTFQIFVFGLVLCASQQPADQTTLTVINKND